MSTESNKVRFYYINLERSTGRRIAAEKQATEHGIALERVAAVDGRLIKQEDLAAYDSARRLSEYKADLSMGEHACMLSHLKTLRQFLQTDGQFAVVLEDDFVLHPRFKDGIDWLTRKTSGWQAVKLYTGDGKLYSVGKKAQDGSPWELVFPKKLPWVTVGTIYTREGAKTILKSFERYWMGYDVQWAWHMLTQKIPVAGISPGLVETADPNNLTSTIDDGGSRYNAPTPTQPEADTIPLPPPRKLTIGQYLKHRISVWRMAFGKLRMRCILKRSLRVSMWTQTPRFKLERIINKGARRLCMIHPENPDLCIKVAMYYKHVKQLQRDLYAYKAVYPHISEFLPFYCDELVDTNLGPGLVCEIVKDDDGTNSRMLIDYVNSRNLNKRTYTQLAVFAKKVLEHNIPFYDMNPNNFLVQIKNGKQRLLYIDLKYYNDYKPWIYLHLEKCIPALSRMIVKRRLQRLFKWLDKQFPGIDKQ